MASSGTLWRQAMGVVESFSCTTWGVISFFLLFIRKRYLVHVCESSFLSTKHGVVRQIDIPFDGFMFICSFKHVG